MHKCQITNASICKRTPCSNCKLLILSPNIGLFQKKIVPPPMLRRSFLEVQPPWIFAEILATPLDFSFIFNGPPWMFWLIFDVPLWIFAEISETPLYFSRNLIDPLGFSKFFEGYPPPWTENPTSST